MRQLVSVVTDESIAYLVHDGDHTVQIAQVMNVGLGVADVITLGVNLGDVLRLPTMKLNGNGEHAVERQERRALPPGRADAELSPHEAKQRQRVACPVAGPRCAVDYKRTSVSRHLEDVHKWKHAAAMRYEHTAKAIDGEEIDIGPNRSKYVPTPKRATTTHSDPNAPRAKDGRLLGPRHSVTDEWPNATVGGVFAEIERHPDGVSVAEIASVITANTARGRQTIGNKLQTLRSQGVVETFDGMRPHYRSGKLLPTMLIRVKR